MDPVHAPETSRLDEACAQVTSLEYTDWTMNIQSPGFGQPINLRHGLEYSLDALEMHDGGCTTFRFSWKQPALGGEPYNVELTLQDASHGDYVEGLKGPQELILGEALTYTGDTVELALRTVIDAIAAGNALENENG